jgi:hypothetical protein
MNEAVNYLCENNIKMCPRKADCRGVKWNELGQEYPRAGFNIVRRQG